jgi:2-methylcitrate dehydratase PrpD
MEIIMGFSKHEIITDITKQLSRYIIETKYEDIPPAVAERAKNLILHTIGVSLAGLDLQQGKDALELAKEMSAGDAPGVATLWGDGGKVSWVAAALLGGTLGDMLDWEDCSWTGHPSAGVVPSAVIAAEVLHKSGKDLIAAVVTGYEVYQRIAMSAAANINGLNIFASVVPIAKLVGLNEKQVNQALSMAASCSAIPVNIHEATMSDSLNYLYGFKTEGAVAIVRNALLGIDNLEDALDDPTAYSAHMRNSTPEWFLKDLGTDYFLMDILVKHWPANMYVQTYAELADTIRRKYKIDPDHIERIDLNPAVQFRFYQSETGYESLTQAQFSIPYCVAAVFYHPYAGSVWYYPETMKDPKVVALMNKVHAKAFCDDAGKQPFRGVPGLKQLIRGYHPEKIMTVRLKNGTEYSEALFSHLGHPNQMFTREQFDDNFREETAVILSPNEANQVIRLIRNLENLPDASELAAHLFSKQKGGELDDIQSAL